MKIVTNALFTFSFFLLFTGQSLADPPRYSSYNPSNASNYAYTWALSKNPNYPDYSQYVYQGGDCTNFASQALHTGGWDYTRSRVDTDAGSWYVSWNSRERKFSNSQTWASASAFYRRLINYKYEKTVQPTNDLFSLRPGDLAFLTRGGISHHTMVVTGYKDKVWWNPFAGYGPLVSYHNGGTNEPKQNILLTDVIAKSPDDTPVFAKIRS